MFGLTRRKNKSPVDLLKAGKLQRRCSVYMHREKPHSVIATLFGNGIMFELDGEVRTYEGTSDIDLGEVVKERFMFSEVRPYTSEIRTRKRTEWPAYKQSLSTSVAAFENDYIHISVCGANEANIIVRLESEPLVSGLSVTTHCNPLLVKELGEELNKIHKHYLKWERP